MVSWRESSSFCSGPFRESRYNLSENFSLLVTFLLVLWLTFFHADFGKEFPSRTLWRGPSWNCPSPSCVLCTLLYRTEHFRGGEKVPRKGEEVSRVGLSTRWATEPYSDNPLNRTRNPSELYSDIETPLRRALRRFAFLVWESTENWDFHRSEPYTKPYSDTGRWFVCGSLWSGQSPKSQIAAWHAIPQIAVASFL